MDNYIIDNIDDKDDKDALPDIENMNLLNKFIFEIIGIEHAYQGLEGNCLVLYNDIIFQMCGFCGGKVSWGFVAAGNNHPLLSLAQEANLLKNFLVQNVLFKRGFYNDIFVYNITQNSWKNLMKLPLKPRQNVSYILINNLIYIFGGFSYTPLTEADLKTYSILPSKQNVYTYGDGCCWDCSSNSVVNNFVLPINITDSGTVYHISQRKLYILNGAEYDGLSFNSFKLLPKYNTSIGKLFLRFDISENGVIIEDTNAELSKFPGTGRFGHIYFLKDNFIYIISGCSTVSDVYDGKGYKEYVHCNVIDNWKYDISNNIWSRLKDYPLPMCFQGFVVYKNKYVIIIGGNTYNKTIIYPDSIINTEQKIVKNELFPYNNISNIRMGDNKGKIECRSTDHYNGYFSNMIVIYDIEADNYTISKHFLPLNISSPKLVIKDDIIYIIGSEANPSLINNKYYGNHLGCIIKLKIYTDNILDNTRSALTPPIQIY